MNGWQKEIQIDDDLYGYIDKYLKLRQTIRQKVGQPLGTNQYCQTLD